MATYETLRQAINSLIKTNGNEEITGAILNQVLNAMITALGANYQFCGEATPSTNPGQPMQNVFYFAYDAGTYVNFGNITLPMGISTLSWDGTQWTGETIYQIDSTPVLNSTRLITSGGVYNALATITQGTHSGFLYAGIAEPTDSPSALVNGQRIFYLATQAGTYTNFLVNYDIPMVIPNNGIWVLTSGADDDDWTAQEIVGIDDKPTSGSNNLVKSGGVFNELALGAIYDVSAKNPTAGPNNDGKWESLSALLNDANLNTLIPVAVRKGGMSIKFVQTSDNKYVQFRLMHPLDNASTAAADFANTANWQGVVLDGDVFDNPDNEQKKQVASIGSVYDGVTKKVFNEEKYIDEENSTFLTENGITSAEMLYSFIKSFSILVSKDEGYQYGILRVNNGLPADSYYAYYIGLYKWPENSIPTSTNTILIGKYVNDVPLYGTVDLIDNNNNVTAKLFVDWSVLTAQFGGHTIFDGIGKYVRYNQDVIFSSQKRNTLEGIVNKNFDLCRDANTNLGYYVCTSTLSARKINVPNYVLKVGGAFKVKMTERITSSSAVTFNINNTGAIQVYYNGREATVSNTWGDNEIIEVFYDGNIYQTYKVAAIENHSIFNISRYNSSSVTYKTYSDLDTALADVPVFMQKSGLNICFINSSTEKYEQYTLTSKTWSTNANDWQKYYPYIEKAFIGIDDENWFNYSRNGIHRGFCTYIRPQDRDYNFNYLHIRNLNLLDNTTAQYKLYVTLPGSSSAKYAQRDFSTSSNIISTLAEGTISSKGNGSFDYVIEFDNPLTCPKGKCLELLIVGATGNLSYFFGNVGEHDADCCTSCYTDAQSDWWTSQWTVGSSDYRVLSLHAYLSSKYVPFSDFLAQKIRIRNNSLTTELFVNKSVIKDKIADRAVGNKQIEDGSITAAKFADDALDYVVAEALKGKLSIVLPPVIYAVPGTEINLWNDTISWCLNKGLATPTNYNVSWYSPNIGIITQRGFRFTPEANHAGHDYSVRCDLYDVIGNLIKQKTITIKVKAQNALSTAKNIAFFGASTGPSTIVNMMDDFGNSNKFTGIVPTSYGYREKDGVRHNCVGGYTWADFATAGRAAFRCYITSDAPTIPLNAYYTNNGFIWQVVEVNIDNGSGNILITKDSTTYVDHPTNGGTLVAVDSGMSDIVFDSYENAPANPLWDETLNDGQGGLSISHYKNVLQVPQSLKFDAVSFVLTINGNHTTTAIYNMIKSLYDLFIDDNHNCKFIIALGTTSNTENGYGINYGASIPSIDFIDKTYVRNNLYLSLLSDTNMPNVRICPQGNECDRYYGFPFTSRQISQRYTQTEQVHSNAVHPSSSGYGQLGDAFFAMYVGVLTE